MKISFERATLALALILIVGLPSVLVADGMNDSGFRLVGSTMDRWAGSSGQNGSDDQVLQVGLFYEDATRQNADGFMLKPALAFGTNDPRRQDILNHLLGIVTLSAAGQTLLDINHDGRLDIADVVVLSEPSGD